MILTLIIIIIIIIVIAGGGGGVRATLRHRCPLIQPCRLAQKLAPGRHLAQLTLQPAQLPQQTGHQPTIWPPTPTPACRDAVAVLDVRYERTQNNCGYPPSTQ